MNAYREELSRLSNDWDPAKIDKQIEAAKAENQTAEQIKLLEADRDKAESKLEEYSNYLAEVEQSWSNFQNQAGDYVKLIADSGQSAGGGVSGMFALKAFAKTTAGDKTTITGVTEYASGESHFEAMKAAQNRAIEDQKNVSSIEDELIAKRGEYNDAMSGKKPALPDKS